MPFEQPFFDSSRRPSAQSLVKFRGFKFSSGKIPGVIAIDADKHGDARGNMVRTWCKEAFHELGLNISWDQHSLTYTEGVGTLRGMHLQFAPFEEIKLIRCVTGRVWDCLVDLRPDSPAYGRWEAFDLNEENERALYVPEGIAHGFLALSGDIRMHYMMSAPYSAAHAGGIRWDDPSIGIRWPTLPKLVSEKDRALPLFSGL